MGASVLGNGVVLTDLSGRRQNSAADLLQRAVTTTGLHRQLRCGMANGSFVYSGSRRAFLRLRLRAKACFTRSFWPGFR